MSFLEGTYAADSYCNVVQNTQNGPKGWDTLCKNNAKSYPNAQAVLPEVEFQNGLYTNINPSSWKREVEGTSNLTAFQYELESGRRMTAFVALDIGSETVTYVSRPNCREDPLSPDLEGVDLDLILDELPLSRCLDARVEKIVRQVT